MSSEVAKHWPHLTELEATLRRLEGDHRVGGSGGAGNQDFLEFLRENRHAVARIVRDADDDRNRKRGRR